VTGDGGATEKLREWFGTPVAAGKTLLWFCWASFLVSLFIGFVGLLASGVQALFN
jgi:hypothetical protein